MENLNLKAEISTLEAEGIALGKMWQARTTKWKAEFSQDIKPRQDEVEGSGGFDTRLGNLVRELKAESEAGRISGTRLQDCGIQDIDKRRRSEALWFVENEDECRKFIKTSKKGFTSLTALQASMKKASITEDTSTDSEDTSTDSETDIKSNDGPVDTLEKFQLFIVTKFELAKAIQKLCDHNDIDQDDLMEIMMMNNVINEDAQKEAA